MNTWTTPINNTGRQLNGTKLVNIQAYITRVAPVFGMTVLASEIPSGLDPVNVDSIRIEIEHLVKSVQRGLIGGAGAKFINLSNSIGVQLDEGPVIVDSVTGLAVSNEAQLTFDLDWNAYVPDDAGPVVYDIEIYDTDLNPDTLVLTLSDQSGIAVTVNNAAIDTLTNYKVRIKAKWNAGANSTPWSAFVTFATLNAAAPVGLSITNEATTTADVDWDAKVIEAFSITYDVEVLTQSGDTLTASSYGQAGITFAATGLSAATAYYARVRAVWTDGTVKTTAYSASVNFSTTA